MVTLYISELWDLPMNTIAILALLSILSGVVTLSISGFSIIDTVVAQMADNATMGNRG